MSFREKINQIDADEFLKDYKKKRLNGIINNDKGVGISLKEYKDENELMTKCLKE